MRQRAEVTATFSTARWRQTENKASRPHSIPLPPLALALVGKGDARDYVFAGRLGKIGGF